MFYWICDCSAMKEILNYDGQIHVVRRWAQELLGYHFAVIHRPARMCADVDALSRRYEGLVRQYMLYAAKLSAADRARRPAAYDPSTFPAQATKCPTPAIATKPSTSAATPCPSLFVSAQQDARPTYTDPMLAFVDRVAFTSCPAPLVTTVPPIISTASSRPSFAAPVRSFTTSVARADSGLSAQPLANVCSTWLSVDPGIPSIATMLPHLNPLSCVLPVVMVPTAAALSLATSMLPTQATTVVSSTATLCAQLRSRLHTSTNLCRSMHQHASLPTPLPDHAATPSPNDFILPTIHGVDFTLPASSFAHSSATALPWLLRTLAAIQLLTRTNPLRAFVIIIPCSGSTDDTSALTAAVHSHCSPTDWLPCCSVVNTASAGDLVSSIRWLAVAHRSAAPSLPSPFEFPTLPSDPLRSGYGPLVLATRNNCDKALLALRADALRVPPAGEQLNPLPSNHQPPASCRPPSCSPAHPPASCRPPSCSPAHPPNCPPALPSATSVLPPVLPLACPTVPPRCATALPPIGSPTARLSTPPRQATLSAPSAG